jgi:dCMP deaminase
MDQITNFVNKDSRWDNYFMNLAILSANMSKDPSTKVGASIRGPDKSVISIGFNGFPSNIPDNPEDLLNREYKYKHIIHAEDNAIRYAVRQGEIPSGSTIYTTIPPCLTCYNIIRSYKINNIVSMKPTEEQYERWKKDWDIVFNSIKKDNVHFSFFEQ